MSYFLNKTSTVIGIHFGADKNSNNNYGNYIGSIIDYIIKTVLKIKERPNMIHIVEDENKSINGCLDEINKKEKINLHKDKKIFFYLVHYYF